MSRQAIPAVLLLTCLICWPGPSHAQAENSERSEILKKDENAIELAQQALEKLKHAEEEFGPEHWRVAVALNNLASAYKDQKRYDEAEPLFKRSLAILEKIEGPEHTIVAAGIDHLANLYKSQGRYDETEPLYKRSIAILEKTRGPDHPDVARTLNSLALIYYRFDRYAEAAPLLERALAIQEKSFPPDHHNVVRGIENLAGLYKAQGRYAEAETLFERSLAIREKTLGSDHPGLVRDLKDLAETRQLRGGHIEAERLYKRALAITEETHGPDHPDLARTFYSLAELYTDQGRRAEAEPLYKRVLEITEKVHGPEHVNMATALNALGSIYFLQGHYAKAEPLFRRALAIREKAPSPNHRGVSESLINLAVTYSRQARYPEAEPLYERALEMDEKILGPSHPDVATSLNRLAGLRKNQGRYLEAEPLLRRSLAIREDALGPDHPDVGKSLDDLARLYARQGRYEDAEPLFKRALAIREKSLGPEHLKVAVTLNNLATLYMDQDRKADAMPLMERSVMIVEKTLGPDHPDLATTIGNLAALQIDQGRYGEAEVLLKRSLAIREKALGPNHPSVATALNNLASVYFTQNRYGDAEPLGERALAIVENILKPDHPNVARLLDSLADIYKARGRTADALDKVRRATAIHRDRARRSGGDRTGGGLSEQSCARCTFIEHVELIWAMTEKRPADAVALTAEAFEVGQLAKATSTGAAVAGMSARFAAGDDALGRVVRQLQDAGERWKRLDNKVLKTATQSSAERDPAAEKQLHAQLAGVSAKLNELNERLTREFPEYAELVSPRPLSVAAARKLLGPQEALMAYMVADEETFLWLIRRDDARIFNLDIGWKELSETAALLRGDLDPTFIKSLADIAPFDTMRAFRLYERIFSAAEPFLSDIRHLFVVPDGALQSLPLGVLVTSFPQSSTTDFAGYRDVPWLVKRFALTTLPSVSSLQALRRFADRTRANKPFGGFGDPLLEGHPGERRGVEPVALFSSRGLADVNALRTKLAPLPETADELKSIARVLGSSEEHLFLREQATESLAKLQALDDYRILAFATHGLVASDLEDLAEPALVMTPPETATKIDDGLLTASEVATIRLNADLVVLSACNTAAADGTPGAEALSGLAKAFFYAGSRALLVSHWPVNSAASVKLTTGMLKEIANHNGRAEALRRSMLALMRDKGKPHYAHPMFWAPFVVVGEGGTYQVN